MSAVPHLTGLGQIAGRYDAFVLDIFGLLHNGVVLYPGTVECLRELGRHGKQVCLVSNTPRMPDDVRTDLQAKGLPPDLYHHVVTAGLAARHDLEVHHQGKRIWFAGKPDFHGFINDLDLLRVADPKDADLLINAVSGMTAENDEELYTHLSRGLEYNRPMLCANPDMVVHIGEDMFNCAGTYAAWYENHGGRVTYHGKPYPSIYQLALQALGSPDPGRVCAAGDALHTDIQGAGTMGFDSVWNLVGIHWEELRLSEQPGEPDLDRVAETITMSPHKPTATLTQFRW